jgi:hypothetical protein
MTTVLSILAGALIGSCLMVIIFNVAFNGWYWRKWDRELSTIAFAVGMLTGCATGTLAHFAQAAP